MSGHNNKHLRRRWRRERREMEIGGTLALILLAAVLMLACVIGLGK